MAAPRKVPNVLSPSLLIIAFEIPEGESHEILTDKKYGENKYERVLSAMDKWIGKIIDSIDLYDFLISGNGMNSVSLQPGDSLLVNPSKKSIKIFGEVLRPAIYELKDDETLVDIIKYALGFSPTADLQNISINSSVVMYRF